MGGDVGARDGAGRGAVEEGEGLAELVEEGGGRVEIAEEVVLLLLVGWSLLVLGAVLGEKSGAGGCGGGAAATGVAVAVGTAVAREEELLRVGDWDGVRCAAAADGVRPLGVHDGGEAVSPPVEAKGVDAFWSFEGEVRMGWCGFVGEVVGVMGRELGDAPGEEARYDWDAGDSGRRKGEVRGEPIERGRVCRLGVGGETGRRLVNVSDGKNVKISTISGPLDHKNAGIDKERLNILCNAARASGTGWKKGMRSHWGSKQCQESRHNPCADHGKGPTWHLENPLSIHISKPQHSLPFTTGDERHRLLRSVANVALHCVIGCARFHVENVSF